MSRFSFPALICIFLILAACSNKMEQDKQKLLSVLHSAYFSAQASYAKLGYFPEKLDGLKELEKTDKSFVDFDAGNVAIEDLAP